MFSRISPTVPDICPIDHMAWLGEAEQVLVEAGDEPFRGILVTVDPERDTARCTLGLRSGPSRTILWE